MKLLWLLVLAFACGPCDRRAHLVSVPEADQPASETATDFYNIAVHDLHGRDFSLGDYRGKVLLIVNVASQCGYTPQYAELEQLYQRFRGQGLEVLAVPCNDFGGQEPGGATEIEATCRGEYGTTFPVLEKVTLRSDDARHPLYRHLVAASGQTPSWNFGKYLVARDGRVHAFFGSQVSPLDGELVQQVEALLGQH